MLLFLAKLLCVILVEALKIVYTVQGKEWMNVSYF